MSYFRGKGQHCHFLVTMLDQLGDSHGPNAHALHTRNKRENQNLLSLKTGFLFLRVHVHHQIFFHLILRNFHL